MGCFGVASLCFAVISCGLFDVWLGCGGFCCLVWFRFGCLVVNCWFVWCVWTGFGGFGRF